jgi:nicotinate-nucleotide pyrophosphorylase (carboxylating)
MSQTDLEEFHDIRDLIFQNFMHQSITAAILCERPGVLSGVKRARVMMEDLGLSFQCELRDGASLETGQEIARVIGNPLQISRAEERIIGALSKPSGVATAARRAKLGAGSHCKVVSGGWKKMPLEIKAILRQALCDGGIGIRITEDPFIYLDKNYVRIFGGVPQAVEAATNFNRKIVVQVRGETAPIEKEAVAAAQAGVSVVMIDTARREDLTKVSRALKQQGWRTKVQIAFAGNISIEDVPKLSRTDVDYLDIGYAILDAPCLPMSFDVLLRIDEKSTGKLNPFKEDSDGI